MSVGWAFLTQWATPASSGGANLVSATLAAILSPSLAALAAVLLVMGGIGDCTQQRVLKQSAVQLAMIKGGVEAAVKGQ